MNLAPRAISLIVLGDQLTFTLKEYVYPAIVPLLTFFRTNTGQTLLYLIRRSYGFIYTLLISSEPVSEALLPVYNQLQTLRRCLLEVKEAGGVSTARELYPYSMKVSRSVQWPNFLSVTY